MGGHGHKEGKAEDIGSDEQGIGVLADPRDGDGGSGEKGEASEDEGCGSAVGVEEFLKDLGGGHGEKTFYERNEG
jgi:hypothetical protein